MTRSGSYKVKAKVRGKAKGRTKAKAPARVQSQLPAVSGAKELGRRGVGRSRSPPPFPPLCPRVTGWHWSGSHRRHPRVVSPRAANLKAVSPREANHMEESPSAP